MIRMQLPAAEAQIVSHLDQILPFKTYSKIQKRISELIPIETVRFKVEETNITKFSLEDWLQAQIRDPIKKKEMSYGHNYFYQARKRERQGNQPEIGDFNYDDAVLAENLRRFYYCI